MINRCRRGRSRRPTTSRTCPTPPATCDPDDRGAARVRVAIPPPPTLATPRNHLPPLPPIPAPAAVQLMDPDPAHRAPPPHPGHPVPHSGPQPRITPHNAAGLRDLDTHGHGADRCAPRSNGRGRCGTASSPSPHPANHMLQTLIHPGAEQTARLSPFCAGAAAGQARLESRSCVSPGQRQAAIFSALCPTCGMSWADGGCPTGQAIQKMTKVERPLRTKIQQPRLPEIIGKPEHHSPRHPHG